MKSEFCFKSLKLLFLLCMVPLWAFGQSITVKGVVKDTAGEPVIGASVVEKGTTNGIITDFEVILNSKFHRMQCSLLHLWDTSLKKSQ